MATEFHYAFFRSIYEEEDARYSSLIDRGKIYLSIISIFFGGIFFKLDWIVENRHWLRNALWFYVGGVACFFAALILVCLSLQILAYEAPSDPNKVIEQGELELKQPLFINARITDLAVAYQRNSRQNDRRALLLRFALSAIVLGVLCMLAGVFLLLI